VSPARKLGLPAFSSAAILLTLLVANAAGCTSDSSPPAGVAGSPAATSAAPISNRDQVCEAVIRWAGRTSYDATRTVVLDFLSVHGDPGRFSVREKLAIRRAYFAFQEKGYRSIAATATEPKLSAALHAFADGWAGFAKNPSVDSKLWEQPDRTALNKYSPWRVIGVPDPAVS
jgi:hypothetical protein